MKICRRGVAPTTPPTIVPAAVVPLTVVLTACSGSGSGIASSRPGTAARPDGTRQLTGGGRPVHRRSGGSASGPAAGQGTDGCRYAVPPSGSTAGAAGGTS